MQVFVIVTSSLAMLVSVSTIATFFVARKRAAIEEGMHLRDVQQLRIDLDKAHTKIRELTERLQGSVVDMAKIATNIDNLLQAVNRIETKLDKHIGAHALEDQS